MTAPPLPKLTESYNYQSQEDYTIHPDNRYGIGALEPNLEESATVPILCRFFGFLPNSHMDFCCMFSVDRF